VVAGTLSVYTMPLRNIGRAKCIVCPINPTVCMYVYAIMYVFFYFRQLDPVCRALRSSAPVPLPLIILQFDPWSYTFKRSAEQRATSAELDNGKARTGGTTFTTTGKQQTDVPSGGRGAAVGAGELVEMSQLRSAASNNGRLSDDAAGNMPQV